MTLSVILFFLFVFCIPQVELQHGYFQVPTEQFPTLDGCVAERTVVNCSGLGLTTTPQDIPSNATVLDLSYNCIPVLKNNSLASLPHLTHLNISYSCVHDIQIGAFHSVSNLKVLNLEHNNLTVLQKFSFSTLDSLEKLLLSHNNLTAIDPESLHNLSNLTSLELNHNGLNSFNNGSLSGNEDCPFAMIGKLQKLLLHGNSIDAIDAQSFCGLSNLTKLDLSHNNISYIRNNSFPDLESLETLNIANNFIDDIEEDAFHYLSHLRELHLQNNSLSFLHNDTFYPCTNLESLNISFNNLTKIVIKPLFHYLYHFKSLDLSHNKLDLSHHKPEIACDDLIMFKGLQHLEWLDISFTGDIWSIADCGQTLENITNLVTLNISNCRISNIPPEAFKNQKNLQYLDLQQNTISTLPTNIFQEQKYLQYLDMSSNDLHSLPGGIFNTCNSTNLSIKLKGNHIGSLPEGMFSLLHTAVELDLCDNEFHHINDSTLAVIQNVSIINLSGNPFECDCELAHFVNWAKSHETQVVGWNNNFTDGFNVTNNDYYRCNGKSLENFDEDCHSSTVEYLVPSLVVIVVIVAFVVGYLLKKTIKRHRQGYQNIVGSDQAPLPITKHYKYDLYVIHSSEDLEWVQMLTAKLEVEGHYKISYPDKDFVLGHTIFKNIDNFLEQSRTILGIISTNALNSPWCCYELERARTLEIEQRGDHKLIPILLEDRELLLKHMERKEYSYAIVHLIQNKTNLEWSEDGRLEPEYWKRLKKDIGKPVVLPLVEGKA